MLTPAPARRTWSIARRLLIGSLGAVLLAIGVAMLVLPGPGALMIFFGLAVLSTEFAWARRALERTRGRAREGVALLRGDRTARLGAATSAGALLVGGALALVVLEEFRYVGLGAIAAGIAGFALFVPAVQRIVLGEPIEPGDTDSDSNTPGSVPAEV